MAHILVIEDDESLRKALRRALRDLGHVVVVANDGREGVSRYREDHPDLVITDIVMPVQDGLEVIRELAPGGVPIIAMSGAGCSGPTNVLDDAIRLGAFWALEKPFTVEALIAAVDEALRSPSKVFRPTPAA